MVNDMENQFLGTVVMIHGLWMRGWELAWLGGRFRRLGYQVVYFRYPTVRKKLTITSDDLYKFCQQVTPPVYLLSHSLGGLLALNMLLRHPNAVCRRMVAIATPFQGSHVARKIAKIPGIGRRILGGSLDHGLLHGAGNILPAGCEIGVIAGNLSRGLSNTFLGLPSPNDGTVAVAETRLGGVEHMQLPHIHMGLLFSSQVCEKADKFFKKGRFDE